MNFKFLFFLSITVFSYFNILSQDRTLGVLNIDSDQVYDGYTLLTSHETTDTYLINNCGEQVHKWTSDYYYGNTVELLPNGNLLRATRLNSEYFINGGAGGRIEVLDDESNILWEYDYISPTYRQHHDVVYLPNGNFLFVAWDRKDSAEAVAYGRNPDLVPDNGQIWSEKLVEVRPIGSDSAEIVWEWYLWDHLVQEFDPNKPNYGAISENIDRVDLNYIPNRIINSWIHINSIDYNEELDQILVGSRFFSELWVIDHSTTTEEAATAEGGLSGKGGRLLYRYGNPQVYSANGDRILYGQHNAQWINSNDVTNNILVFNNGYEKEPSVSAIEFINFPVNGYNYDISNNQFDYSTPYLSYESTSIEGFNFSSFISGVQLLPNGNILICSGPSGSLVEISPEAEVLWHYLSPISNNGILEQGASSETINNSSRRIFRAKKYDKDFVESSISLNGSLEPIELNSSEYVCPNVLSNDSKNINFLVYPNPANNYLYVELDKEYNASVLIYDISGRLMLESELFSSEKLLSIDISSLDKGLYNLIIKAEGKFLNTSIIKK
ncbi:aryl-sulfate sulfotransferase [Marivirga sp.]|uniref:aryl-sulfate sulfotransferase n=1 Tax=Marivirga sp. TaxID=2018662 RepID=UPI0025E2F36A|nr:aryl-sulfate sulfotransferase [Marivirga sp.]